MKLFHISAARMKNSFLNGFTPVFPFAIDNWENWMKIFSKCISCHETGVACAPWGLSIKENVAEHFLLLELVKNQSCFSFMLLSVCPMHFYENLWWKIAFRGHEITFDCPDLAMPLYRESLHFWWRKNWKLQINKSKTYRSPGPPGCVR